jgi:ferredoxin-NADP reductase
LVRRQHEAENVTSFFFRPEPPLRYQAGQYLRYTLPHPHADARGITRSFTLASYPAEPLLRLTTRLSALPLVFIAGGIGITPFRSILGELASSRERPTITLLYSNRTADIPFRSFLDALVPDWPALRLVYTVTGADPDWRGARGRIDGAFIRRELPDPAGTLFFVSGPTGLVDAMRATLAELGVEPGRIKSEAFPGYDR